MAPSKSPPPPKSTDAVEKQILELSIDENAPNVIHQKNLAAERLNKAKTKRDQEIQSLKDEQAVNARKGELIQLHSSLVDECRQYVQQFVDQQMDWTNMELAIKLEKKKPGSIARYIELPLRLKENRFVVRLEDPDSRGEVNGKSLDGSDENSESDSNTDSDSDSDSDSASDSDDTDSNKEYTSSPAKEKSPAPDSSLTEKYTNKGTPVSIDYTLSSYANASFYFEIKKAAEAKQAKVQKGAEIAYKNAEKKINQDLVKNLRRENGGVSKSEREKFWFESFYWFVSSEGYLCLAGRTKSQTDMLYFKYFSDDDFLVSSEIEGSLKVFVKNPLKGESVPPSTILQAGIFAMSASQAWNGKVNTAAWVLHGSEVSKYSSSSGALLPPGDFEYLAKKHFLPPAQLVMGFGLYFLVDEESAERYKQQRVGKEKEHGLVRVLDNKKRVLENTKVTNVKTEEVLEERGSELDDTDSEIQDSSTTKSKRAKSKKNTLKYDDLDEEEKELRMKLLGIGKKNKEVKRESKVSQAPKTKGDANEASRQKQEEEVQGYLLEADASNEALSSFFDTMDYLTPKPAVGDTVLDVVPVFAPWSALQKFKYKAKIQPGLAKKGKSINEIINYFTKRRLDTSRSDPDVDWPAERELVNAVKPNDLMGVFTVNKMRLIVPKNK
ncbi:hypothetical protein KGF57_003868 [Candida theae]|uniref:NFACT RNA-binding domain-containing protein n=1 Tax=Candida theae TaxID=1198502 RepID=A0AAD5BCY9_9ASCO|nr:uncharacterized protein KGF57_003868 [Candida theae]KAI5954843.1 hypothetical protein KGF57_003868 [Candida theae]